MRPLRLSLSTGKTLFKDTRPYRGAMEFRNNNKRQVAMFKHTKIRQAGLILFATTLLLIVPNLTKVIG